MFADDLFIKMVFADGALWLDATCPYKLICFLLNVLLENNFFNK